MLPPWVALLKLVANSLRRTFKSFLRPLMVLMPFLLSRLYRILRHVLSDTVRTARSGPISPQSSKLGPQAGLHQSFLRSLSVLFGQYKIQLRIYRYGYTVKNSVAVLVLGSLVSQALTMICMALLLSVLKVFAIICIKTWIWVNILYCIITAWFMHSVVCIHMTACADLESSSEYQTLGNLMKKTWNM